MTISGQQSLIPAGSYPRDRTDARSGGPALPQGVAVVQRVLVLAARQAPDVVLLPARYASAGDPGSARRQGITYDHPGRPSQPSDQPTHWPADARSFTARGGPAQPNALAAYANGAAGAAASATHKGSVIDVMA